MKQRNLKELYRQFRQWQQRPYQVAPMSDKEQECATCHTHYTGNYCPRCGQSSRIGRYSFKNAFMMFLNVWGLGNRSMFRTLRDLLFRPGYMIRDYLRGMQMAYYPPFNMFFLLTALSILVSTRVNIQGRNMLQETIDDIYQGFDASITVDDDAEALSADSAFIGDAAFDDAAHFVEEQTAFQDSTKETVSTFLKWQQDYPNIFSLGLLLLFSGFFYIFFRKSPAIPDMRYSELVVSMVYISNMLSIYTIVFDFFCLDQETLCQVVYLLMIVPFKQLSGFGWWRTIWYIFLSILLMSLLLVIVSAIATVIGLVMMAQG